MEQLQALRFLRVILMVCVGYIGVEEMVLWVRSGARSNNIMCWWLSDSLFFPRPRIGPKNMTLESGPHLRVYSYSEIDHEVHR